MMCLVVDIVWPMSAAPSTMEAAHRTVENDRWRQQGLNLPEARAAPRTTKAIETAAMKVVLP